MQTEQPSAIEEGTIRFIFGSRWTVCKYDEHLSYRHGIEKLDGTKAVDFLGLLDDSELYLIEVKDFRGHRIENKQRISSGELWVEVGQKVRDSLAGMIGAHRISERDTDFWEQAVEILQDKQKDIKVILWLEEDMHSDQKSRKVGLSVQANELKKRLRWLTTKVLVCNANTNPLTDLNTINLPQPWAKS